MRIIALNDNDLSALHVVLAFHSMLDFLEDLKYLASYRDMKIFLLEETPRNTILDLVRSYYFDKESQKYPNTRDNCSNLFGKIINGSKINIEEDISFETNSIDVK